MAFWIRHGPRQRMVDTTWPAALADSPRGAYPSDGALRSRLRKGRLHRWHRCTCGCIGGRKCNLCGRALCMDCAVRPRRRVAGIRGRAHPRCLVRRDGFVAVLRLLYRHRVAGTVLAARLA